MWFDNFQYWVKGKRKSRKTKDFYCCCCICSCFFYLFDGILLYLTFLLSSTSYISSNGYGMLGWNVSEVFLLPVVDIDHCITIVRWNYYALYTQFAMKKFLAFGLIITCSRLNFQIIEKLRGFFKKNYVNFFLSCVERFHPNNVR